LSPIYSIFNFNSTSSKLEQIATNNLNQLNFIFYTDGSVRNITTERCQMGIGWVQVLDDSAHHTFAAPIKYWPSSYKAELVSILSAICTCPRNSTIHIYTDSQSIISKYDKISSHPPQPNKKYSYNYWPIWHTLLNLIKSYSLNIYFHKVPSHQDNTFNNLADSLAKHQNLAEDLEFKQDNLYNPSFFL
jgi:ribonuclease HI